MMLVRKAIFVICLASGALSPAHSQESGTPPIRVEWDGETETGYYPKLSHPGLPDLTSFAPKFNSDLTFGRGGTSGAKIATPASNKNSVVDCGKNPAGKHPVIIATGEKIKHEVDFEGNGLYPLSMSRTYRGFGGGITAVAVGRLWASNYDYWLTASNCGHDLSGTYDGCVPRTLEFDTPDGSYLYTRPANSLDFKSANANATGTVTYPGPDQNWQVVLGGKTYTFNSGGYLLTIADRMSANVMTYHWTNYQLTSVTNPANQTISFVRSNGYVSQVVAPNGQTWNYSHNTAGYLTQVTTPDNHVTQYGYANPNLPGALTSIIVDGQQVLTVLYYSNGQVQSSGTPDGEEVDRYSYDTGATTLSTQLGDSATYFYQSVQGGLNLTSVSHATTSTCPHIVASTAYDANGWVDYTLDWNGSKTDYTYSADGRLLDITAAAGTASALKHVYSWTTTASGEYVVQSDTEYDTGGNIFRATSYTYTIAGYISSVSVKDQSTGAVASTNYAYTFASNNTLLTLTETRNLSTGPSTTSYSFDSFGNVSSIVDASGATTTYSGYDGIGRPSNLVTSNGVSHSITYDGRGNVHIDTMHLPNGDAQTIYIYDGRGNLVSVSRPDGSSQSFTIAQSGRIAAQTDVAGNLATETFHFTNPFSFIESKGRAVASASGSSISSSTSGTVSATRQIDSLGRDLNVLGNNSQNISYGYDANSNVTSISDVSHTTTNTYDALNRLSKTTLPDASTITFGYAPNGRLNFVSTSRGAQTSYTTNAFGFVTQRSSPDTGLTTFALDTFGRVTQEVRSNGTTVTYDYDSLDRLTSRTSNGNTETYSYASSGINAARLTAISNPTSSSSFGYDGYGNVASQTDVIFGQGFGTSYSHNAAGQLTSMTYPDGLVVTYAYNGAGQVTAVTPSRAGGAATSAVYQPFGSAPYAWAFGNGANMIGSIDADGRMTSLNSVFSKNIGYNTDNTIASISDAAYPDVNETFSYDAQRRLKTTNRASDPQSMGIDTDGNRTSLTRAGVTTSYPILSGGNKVTSWLYMGGDILSDGVRSYSRDEFDRLAQVSRSGQTVGQYRYDAMDRRVYKSTAQGATYYAYSPAGQLLYEQSAQRTVDYVWLAGRLVGISVNQGALQSVHTDWLGRPELVTSTSSPVVVWRASNAVYDRTVTLDTIGGLNVFLPGQYYDSESDLYYNWHRYYDANTGRYIQSDPKGLGGGINTYAYANGRPNSVVDPNGLLGSSDAQFDRFSTSVACMSGTEKLGLAGAGVAAVGVGFIAPLAVGVETATESIEVVFQTGHYIDRWAAIGGDVSAAEQSVLAEIRAMGDTISDEGASFWGRISADGVAAEYRAKVVAGILRVGTIFPLK